MTYSTDFTENQKLTNKQKYNLYFQRKCPKQLKLQSKAKNKKIRGSTMTQIWDFSFK